MVKIGNTHGAEVDKFQANDLIPLKAERVSAPLIAECHACFECRLFDDQLVDRYNFYLRDSESPCRRAAATPADAALYREGVFMVAGNIISRHSQFKPEML